MHGATIMKKIEMMGSMLIKIQPDARVQVIILVQLLPSNVA